MRRKREIQDIQLQVKIMRSIKILTYIAFIFLTFTQCDSLTGPNLESNKEAQTIPSPVPATIKQIADTLHGKQGVNANFLLSEYFESNAELVTVEFTSDVLNIEEAGSDLYSIQQDKSLKGTHPIQALLINSDSDTLEATLTYIIDAESNDLTTQEEEKVYAIIGNAEYEQIRSTFE